MARQITFTRWLSCYDASGFFRCVELFTHRLVLENCELLGDPENMFWARGTTSWYGEQPEGWDTEKAERVDLFREYEMELIIYRENEHDHRSIRRA